jgi:hypothetical protein
MAPAQYLQLINSFTSSVRDKLSSIFTMRVLSCKINGHVYSERKDSQQTAVVRKKDKKARRQIDKQTAQTDSQKGRQIDRLAWTTYRQTDKKTD